MNPPQASSAVLPDGLAKQAQLIADGTVSSYELVQGTIEALEASQPVLEACRVIRAEAALEEARTADEGIAAGESAPLLGVPVAVKDDTNVAGESTNFGCVGEFPVVERDAELVRRLRAAGAVIVAKTTTPEFGQWPFTEGPGFGQTRNPWNTDHTPGGSSGGSASIVAAGLIGAAVGSDGAGSVRIPASWTNLIGIKPQRGRVSTWPDPESFNGLTCNGPLARTVGDAALMLDALTGNHPGELHKPARPAEPFARATEPDRWPTGLRIAMQFDPPFSGAPARLDPRVRERTEELAATLEALGHTVEPREPAYGLIGLTFVPRGSNGVAQWERRVPEECELDHRTRSSARNGRFLGGPVLALAKAAEGLFHRRVGAIFDDFDVLIAPTTAKPPPEIGAIDGLSEIQTDRVMVGACPFAWPWNVLGWPGISVPSGFVDGLPVGTQLLGPEGSEPLLLSLAAELEEALRWHEQRPPGLL
jgi:amidase